LTLIAYADQGPSPAAGENANLYMVAQELTESGQLPGCARPASTASEEYLAGMEEMYDAPAIALIGS